MKLIAKFLIVLGCVAMTTPAIAADELSPTNRASLIRTADEIRSAILHNDLKTLIRLVNGLQCTDDHYDKMQIRKYLSDVNSILYLGLFDARRFSRRCGANYTQPYPATSEKAFFETTRADSASIESVQNDYAVVKFTSPKSGYYPREYTFRKEGAGWALVDGFVVGNCSCG